MLMTNEMLLAFLLHAADNAGITTLPIPPEAMDHLHILRIMHGVQVEKDVEDSTQASKDSDMDSEKDKDSLSDLGMDEIFLYELLKNITAVYKVGMKKQRSRRLHTVKQQSSENSETNIQTNNG